MAKNKLLDKLLRSKILWIVISAIAAVILWMYVITNEQTETMMEIDNVPIVFVGEDTLREKGYIITDIDTSSVNLVIHGSRRALARITNTNITAQIDVSTYNRARAMRLNFEIVYPSGVDKSEITSVEKSAENVAFTIDSLTTKMVDIRIDTSHVTINADYISKEPIADPQTVRLTGASEELKNVSYALVVLEYENLSHSIEGSYSYVLIDNEGNPLEYGEGDGVEYLYKTIEREQDSVYVSLQIQMIKDVVLAVEFTEGGGATAANAKTSIEPAYVTIAGEPEALNSLNQIVLGKVDLTAFVNTYNEEFDIKYPNDVELISGETKAQVSVQIEGLQSTKITTGNIVPTSVPTGYRADLVTKTLEVTVRAPQSIISLIQPENIRVVVDCSAVEAGSVGTISMAARVLIDGYPEAGVALAYKVVVSIVEDAPD